MSADCQNNARGYDDIEKGTALWFLFFLSALVLLKVPAKIAHDPDRSEDRTHRLLPIAKMQASYLLAKWQRNCKHLCRLTAARSRCGKLKAICSREKDRVGSSGSAFLFVIYLSSLPLACLVFFYGLFSVVIVDDSTMLHGCRGGCAQVRKTRHIRAAKRNNAPFSICL